MICVSVAASVTYKCSARVCSMLNYAEAAGISGSSISDDLPIIISFSFSHCGHDKINGRNGVPVATIPKPNCLSA